MLDRKEIEKRLKDVEPQLCAAFAARCSLRVLPLMVADKNEDAFWYWNKTDRSRYVLAVLIAQQISINVSAFGRNVYNTAAAAAAYADTDAYATDAADARTAVRAAVYSVRASAVSARPDPGRLTLPIRIIRGTRQTERGTESDSENA